MKLKAILGKNVKMCTLLYFLFFLTLITPCQAKPPQLTPKETKAKIEEILKAHVSYQSLEPELIKRALKNYLDEIDPTKTYLLEPEVVTWINPSEELLQKTLQGYRQENFETFAKIHDTMIHAIQRRNRLEESIDQERLFKGLQASEFKDLKWVKNEEDLLDRLVRIHSLQRETTEKLDTTAIDQFFQKVTKRRLKREEELTGHSLQEKNQVILSLVLKATSSALDSQTAYFTPSEANQFIIQVQQRLFGIGAQLRDDLNGLTVVRLLEGGPALADNKLKTGDRIIAVDGEPIIGMEITEAVELIRGQENTQVTLTILRESEVETTDQIHQEKFDIQLTRGEVVLKEGRLETHYQPYGDGIIAILHLFSFYQDKNSSSASDLLAAINKLKKEHIIKGIILDLRNNSGGLLPQAVEVTGLFIKKGIVASVKDNSGRVQHLRNIEENIAWDGPLIVLTNLISASAAEIVGQTLQDYGRALVVGDPYTWGKGTFQTFTLETSNYGKVNPTGEFKVTRGRYYTVSGKSPQLQGVKADIIVPGAYSQMEIGEKFSKFPLENDQIPPNFEDTLSDVPLIHRARITHLYKFNLQQVLNHYQPFTERLKNNSTARISLSQNYQNFLKEVQADDVAHEPQSNYGPSDLQLNETVNIMKDLVLLMEKNDPSS